jgi:hypothetical protein
MDGVHFLLPKVAFAEVRTRESKCPDTIMTIKGGSGSSQPHQAPSGCAKGRCRSGHQLREH